MEWLLLLLIAGFASKKRSAVTAPTAPPYSLPKGAAFLINPSAMPVPVAPSGVPSAVDSGGTMLPAPDVKVTNAAVADALTDLNGQYIKFLQDAGYEPKTVTDPGNAYGFTAFITATPATENFVLWAQTFKPSIWDAATTAWNDFQRSLVDAMKLQDFEMAVATVSASGERVEEKLNALIATMAEFETVHLGNVDTDKWATDVLPGLIAQVHLTPADTWEANWPSTMPNSGELGGAVGRMYQAIHQAEEIVLGVGPYPSNEAGIGEAAGILALYHDLHHMALELSDLDSSGLELFAAKSKALSDKVNAAINAINSIAFKRFIAGESVYKLTRAGWGGPNWQWFGVSIDGALYYAPTGVFPEGQAYPYSVPYWPGDREVMYAGRTWIGEWNDQVFLGNTFGSQTAFDTMKAHYQNYFDLVYNPAR